jgi:hypothetical protein
MGRHRIVRHIIDMSLLCNDHHRVRALLVGARTGPQCISNAGRRGPLAPQEVYNLYRADVLSQELRARMQAESQARFAAGLGYDDPALVRAYALMLGLSSHDMTVLRGAFGDPIAVRYAEVSSGGQIVLAVLEYPGDVRCIWEIGNVPQATRTWFDEELTVYGSAQTVTVQFPNPYVCYDTRAHPRDGRPGPCRAHSHCILRRVIPARVAAFPSLRYHGYAAAHRRRRRPARRGDPPRDRAQRRREPAGRTWRLSLRAV